MRNDLRTVHRVLAVLACAGTAALCVVQVAQAQTAAPVTPRRAAPAAPATAAPAQRIDDERWRALADQSEDALEKGNFSAAERIGRDTVEEAKRIFGEGHPNLAASYSILGGALLKQGRYPEAESLFRLTLEIYEKRSGPESINTASALNNLALVLERQADYAGAELLLRRSYGILAKVQGNDHPDTATTLSNLGRVLDSQGKFGTDATLANRTGSPTGAPGPAANLRPAAGPARAAARPTGAAAAQATTPAAGPAEAGDNPQLLLARAEALAAQGQLNEAETLHDRVLAIYLRTVGPEHALTATGYSNLGNVRYLQGKLADAEAAHRQALAIREKVLGPDHPDTATSLNNLANVLFEQGKDERASGAEQRARARAGQRVQSLSEVEGLYRRALAIQERALGPDHPAIANTLNNLSAMLDQQGKSSEAELLQRRALAILEKALGPLHPDTASTLTTLAVSLDRQNKIVESEQVYLRAVDTSRKAGNPRTLLLNSSRLGFALAKRGRYREALPYYREAIETLDRLYVSTRGLSDDTRQAFLGQFGNIYLETIRLLLQLHRANPQAGFDRQILEVASRNQSRVFTEMMRIADVAKFSSEPAFQVLRNRRDTLRERADGLRQAQVTLPPDAPNVEARRTELGAQAEGVSRELRVVEDQLLARYPRYMELTNPRPVSVDDLQQKLLRPGESLLTFVLLPQETVVFGITRDRLKMSVSAVRRDDIARRIHAVRRSIEKVTSGDSVLFLREIDPANLYSLYRDLIQPVADVIAGSNKVIVVGDGPLHTIPLELLVTQWTAQDQQAFRVARGVTDGTAAHPYLDEYSLPTYLGSQYRFAYLPSLSALTSQRLYPKPEGKRSLELIAFADPEFSPEAATGKQFSPATRLTLESMGSSVPRSRDGNPAIPRLIETADEAREIAAVLGGSNDLFIGAKAQEHSAKMGELKNARYVLFATHGFLGGEFLPAAVEAPEGGGPVPTTAGGRGIRKAAAQPALALSLVGDLAGEDGFLTMKEVIEDIELDADLVALSACNTAGESAQANNGEGFAGLTRAFMYAGARSLLVSHWSVDSLSTQALMTTTFRNIKGGEPSLTAVSAAQRALVKTGYSSGAFSFSRSNPFFWAPFVYVGD
jgi:CHAT domain-containing protein/Tfp pilus assembly protein PilF